MSALGRLWALRRSRPGFVAVTIGVLGVLLAVPFVDWYVRDMAAAGVAAFEWVRGFTFLDYGSYATAAARWQEGTVLYWRGMYGNYYGTYLYPPVYVLLFAPLTHLGEVGAFAALPYLDAFEVEGFVLEAASVGLLWVGLQAVARESGLDLAWYDRGVALWALVGFQPLLYSVKLGQVSALVAATFCAAYVAMERGARPDAGRAARLASGAFTVVGSAVKPYYATSGAHLLRDRDRFLGAVGGFVGLVALSVGVFGVANNLAYLDVLTWGKEWGTAPTPVYLWNTGNYFPLYPVATRWPAVSVGLRVLLAVGVAALAVLARRGDARRTTFALGVAVYPLAAPVAYTQDLVALLVVAAVLLAVEFDRTGGRPVVPVLAVGLMTVHAYGVRLLVHHAATSLPPGDAIRAAAPFLQPGVWGNLLLFGLAAYRVGQAVPRSRVAADVPTPG